MLFFVHGACVSHMCEKENAPYPDCSDEAFETESSPSSKWLDPDLDETDIRINRYQTNRQSFYGGASEFEENLSYESYLLVCVPML